jgi:hypothetical protein
MAKNPGELHRRWLWAPLIGGIALREGIKVNTSPTDYFPLEQLQMLRFNGHNWETVGEVLTGEVGGS